MRSSRQPIGRHPWPKVQAPLASPKKRPAVLSWPLLGLFGIAGSGCSSVEGPHIRDSQFAVYFRPISVPYDLNRLTALIPTFDPAQANQNLIPGLFDPYCIGIKLSDSKIAVRLFSETIEGAKPRGEGGTKVPKRFIHFYLKYLNGPHAHTTFDVYVGDGEVFVETSLLYLTLRPQVDRLRFIQLRILDVLERENPKQPPLYWAIRREFDTLLHLLEQK